MTIYFSNIQNVICTNMINVIYLFPRIYIYIHYILYIDIFAQYIYSTHMYDIPIYKKTQ